MGSSLLGGYPFMYNKFMKKYCVECDKWFTVKRTTAKYCSESCKKRNKRVRDKFKEVVIIKKEYILPEISFEEGTIIIKFNLHE